MSVRPRDFLFALALAACAGLGAAAYGVAAGPSASSDGSFAEALSRAWSARLGLTAFLGAGMLAAVRSLGCRDPIRLRAWPFLFLAASLLLGLAARVPGEAARVRRLHAERFAPPGTGEAEDTLPDHYRFLEALAPLVRDRDRIVVVTDRFPHPDLAYWFLPPREGGAATERVNPRVERVATYLRGTGSDWDPPAAVAGLRRMLDEKGVLYDETELPRLLASCDVLVCLDSALDLRGRASAAGIDEVLLDWSPRKYALRRGGG